MGGQAGCASSLLFKWGYMSQIFEHVLDVVLSGLDLVYGERWVAPFVLLPLMFGAAAVVHFGARAKVRPYLSAANERAAALQLALGEDRDPDAERRAFAENYIEVAQAMAAEQSGAHDLVQAWREFQESMVDESASPVRNTSRPSAFFNRAAPKLTVCTIYRSMPLSPPLRAAARRDHVSEFLNLSLAAWVRCAGTRGC